MHSNRPLTWAPILGGAQILPFDTYPHGRRGKAPTHCWAICPQVPLRRATSPTSHTHDDCSKHPSMTVGLRLSSPCAVTSASNCRSAAHIHGENCGRCLVPPWMSASSILDQSSRARMEAVEQLVSPPPEKGRRTRLSLALAPPFPSPCLAAAGATHRKPV
jgi:hypothetical protein